MMVVDKNLCCSLTFCDSRLFKCWSDSSTDWNRRRRFVFTISSCFRGWIERMSFCIHVCLWGILLYSDSITANEGFVLFGGILPLPCGKEWMHPYAEKLINNDSASENLQFASTKRSAGFLRSVVRNLRALSHRNNLIYSLVSHHVVKLIKRMDFVA